MNLTNFGFVLKLNHNTCQTSLVALDVNQPQSNEWRKFKRSGFKCYEVHILQKFANCGVFNRNNEYIWSVNNHKHICEVRLQIRFLLNAWSGIYNNQTEL